MFDNITQILRMINYFTIAIFMEYFNCQRYQLIIFKKLSDNKLKVVHLCTMCGVKN